MSAEQHGVEHDRKMENYRYATVPIVATRLPHTVHFKTIVDVTLYGKVLIAKQSRFMVCVSPEKNLIEDTMVVCGPIPVQPRNPGKRAILDTPGDLNSSRRESELKSAKRARKGDSDVNDSIDVKIEPAPEPSFERTSKQP